MAQKLKYTAEQRREYLNMIDKVGINWVDVFEGDTEFYNAAFWDLLTGIWKAGGSARKTDAAKMMVGIKSTQTAGKYVETALKKNLLVEKSNPKDARSRLVELTPDMKRRLDIFFDAAVGELKQANKRIEKKPAKS